ncbi:ATP-dependent RNA helicase ded1 [Cyphellophora attinorum]|uniref:RNA helicase n=1 Tax=Cyphellophora attinorum TaxID=1664694 RepID=A0A0N1P329_9EURO|nr:ATP-dependent RNA helicase ded1 [Phialophora attinorum]KPI44667.1 ATP-dependent RNA helicase ded1 [Phialophora attinorum]
MTDFVKTEDMAEALPTTDGPPKDQEAYDRAREKGWSAPEPSNYPAENGTEAQSNEVPFVEEAWMHSAQKYEWSEEFGDVGPKITELEAQLFNPDLKPVKGNLFEKQVSSLNLTSIKVIAEAVERPAPIRDFDNAGLHPVIVENIKLSGYDTPTPIQAYTIPAIGKGYDVIGTAQTGSGKTAAYLIPALSKLMGKVKKLAAPRPNLANGFNPDTDMVRAEPLILVVAPTRELCCQIFDESRRLCYRSMLRPCVAYGGGPKREQMDELRKGCDILVATPGRLIDFMSNHPNLLSLNRLRFTIIDEADEMLHDDWEKEMSKIMAGGDTNEDGNHRYMLFSATFNKRMRKLAKKYLSGDHIRIRIGRAGSTHINVQQNVIWVENNEKQKALYDLLISMPPSRTLVFVRSKKTADFVDDYLFNLGLPSTSIHSDRTQREREDAIRAFKSGRAPIMVTTGVSARGLDIRNVMHVINFDLPSIDYDAKMSRTARIGNVGLATSFYNDKDEGMADYLVKILLETGQPIPDFFAERVPEDKKVDFEDDSGAEDDDEGAQDGGGDSW